MKAHFCRLVLVLSCIGITLAPARAALKSAKISDYKGNVTLSTNGGAAQPVQVDTSVTPSDTVRTGAKSLAELEFNDKTLTRLGANTVFSYSPKNREFQVQSGTALLQVPPGLGGAKIETAAVTAAITGTTVMVQKMPNGVVKLLVLEGSMNATLKGSNQMQTIKAGEMLVILPNLKTLPQPVQVNVATIMGTSNLVKGFKDGLTSEDKIEKTVEKQKEMTENGGMKSGGVVITSSKDLLNLVGNQILSSATFDALTQSIDQQTGQNSGSLVVPTGATITPTLNGVLGSFKLPNGTVISAIPGNSGYDANFTLFSIDRPIIFTGGLPTSTAPSQDGLGFLVDVPGIGVGTPAITFQNTFNITGQLDFSYIYVDATRGDINITNAAMDISGTQFYTGYAYSNGYVFDANNQGDINVRNSNLTIQEPAPAGFYSSSKILVDSSTIDLVSANSSVSFNGQAGVSIQNSRISGNTAGSNYLSIYGNGNINVNNSTLAASSISINAMNNANLTIANSNLTAQYVYLSGATLTISGTVINSPSITFNTNNYVNGGGNSFSSTPIINPY